MLMCLSTTFPKEKIFLDSLNDGDTIQEHLKKIISLRIEDYPFRIYVRELRILAEMGYQNKVLKLFYVKFSSYVEDRLCVFVEDMDELLFLIKLHLGAMKENDLINFYESIGDLCLPSFMVVDLKAYAILDKDSYDKADTSLTTNGEDVRTRL